MKKKSNHNSKNYQTPAEQSAQLLKKYTGWGEGRVAEVGDELLKHNSNLSPEAQKALRGAMSQIASRMANLDNPKE